MENLIKNEENIKIYAKIQNELNGLTSDSSEESLDKVISLIPSNYLDQKDELKLICSIFAYYARINSTLMAKNSIRLFQKILTPIKTHLQDESTFFWQIFGGLFYFKLIMHDEGLISIEQIIQNCEKENFVAEFFYPEILKEKPEIFETETKYKLNFPISSESVERFKDLREKRLKWLLNSGDYNDPVYREIETNQLRYSIKTDNVDTFQKILSNSNISINTKISEPALENFLLYPQEISLIEYAVKFNAFKIIKFLLMQNVEYNLNEVLIYSIQNKNYEMIHLIEPKMNKKSNEDSLIYSISTWSDDMTEYSLNKIDSELFESINKDNEKLILDAITQTFISHNFIFLESTIFPFIQKNSTFIENNIFKIIYFSMNDLSFYFTKEFLTFPGLKINEYYETGENSYNSLLGSAIQRGNISAVEMILKNPKIDVNQSIFGVFNSFYLACQMNSDMKIIKLICSHPNFNLSCIFNNSVFDVCASSGNFYALDFILNNFPQLNIGKDLNFCIYLCLKYNNWMVLKIVLLDLFKKNKHLDTNKLVDSFNEEFRDEEEDYDEEIVNQLRKFINKIKP